MMEHIEGRTIADHYGYRGGGGLKAYEETEELQDRYQYKWERKFGVLVGDWHDRNIMVKDNGRRVRIDFSPDCVEVGHSRWFEFLTIVRSEIINLVENFPA
jgi:RIO-like serine/threonine protein kinase